MGDSSSSSGGKGSVKGGYAFDVNGVCVGKPSLAGGMMTTAAGWQTKGMQSVGIGNKRKNGDTLPIKFH